MRHVKALNGIYGIGVATRDLYTGKVTDMGNQIAVPELPAGSSRPLQSSVKQAIPGVTYMPAGTGSSGIMTATPGTIQQTAVAQSSTTAPWYQWFIDNKMATGLILVAVAGGIYYMTKKNKKK